MKLMVKSAEEMLAILDETKETFFKDRKCSYPCTEWKHKRAQVKDRLYRLPEYIRQAVETVNREAQKKGKPQSLTWKRKLILFIQVRFGNKSTVTQRNHYSIFNPSLAWM